MFDYRAAVKLAQDWIARQHRIAAGLETEAPPRKPYTVGEAVADYLADYTARDVLLGLMKTCRKLGVSFFRYLGDRLRVPGATPIPPLPDLVRQAAATPA